MPRTVQQVEAEINQLRNLINSGVKSTTIDGHSVTFDIDSARKSLRALESELADLTGSARKRPRILPVRLPS